MTPVTIILFAVIVAVVLIDLYLKRKNKLATTKEIERVVDKDNPERPWWKKIWIKAKWNKKILIVVLSVILIIPFLYTPQSILNKVFENRSNEEVINICKKYVRIIKFNKNVNEKLIHAIEKKRISRLMSILTSQNDIIKKHNLSFQESIDVLKFYLFKFSNNKSQSRIVGAVPWWQNDNAGDKQRIISHLSKEISLTFPVRSKENPYVIIADNFYLFNNHSHHDLSVQSEDYPYSQFLKEKFGTKKPHPFMPVMTIEPWIIEMAKENGTWTGVTQYDWLSYDTDKLAFYNDFIRKFKYSKFKNELLALSVFYITSYNSMKISMPGEVPLATKYVTQHIDFLKDFNERLPFFIKDSIYENATSFFNDLNLKAGRSREINYHDLGMKEQDYFHFYTDIARYYYDKDDYLLAEKNCSLALSGMNNDYWWEMKADAYELRANCRGLQKQLTSACKDLNLALNLYIENAGDVFEFREMKQGDIAERIRKYCRK